jgi:hypothetical protein
MTVLLRKKVRYDFTTGPISGGQGTEISARCRDYGTGGKYGIQRSALAGNPDARHIFDRLDISILAVIYVPI